jgi:hemerythrin-like domain-containing protein
MTHSTQTARLLDDEHRANLELLGRMENAIARAPSATPGLSDLLRQFAHAMSHDIARHFEFEEEALFPLVADAGDGAIAALLQEEHDAIREVVAELLPLVKTLAEGRIDEASWDRLRIVTLELVERQVAHIQKETMALLPLLEDILEPNADGELALAYAATA